MLVTRDSTATGIDDLAGKRVCAPEATTTLDRLKNDYPDITAVSAPTHTQCLVLFQEGQVDGITGDDTVLAGFAAQDPYAKVVGDAFSSEPYGVGVAEGPGGPRAVRQRGAGPGEGGRHVGSDVRPLAARARRRHPCRRRRSTAGPGP